MGVVGDPVGSNNLRHDPRRSLLAYALTFEGLDIDFRASSREGRVGGYKRAEKVATQYHADI